MRLEPVIGDDPRDILRGLRGALHGAGPALGLGLVQRSARRGARRHRGRRHHVGLDRGAQERHPQPRRAHRECAGDLRPHRRRCVAARAAGELRGGLQVLVRSIVADREPAWLTGAFTPQTFSAAALMMLSTDRGERIPTYTSLVPAQLSKLLDAAASDGTVLAALPLVRDDPRRRSGDRRRHARTGAGCRSPRRADLRLDRDERRMRLRRPAPPRRRRCGSPTARCRSQARSSRTGYLGDTAATDAAFHRDEDGTRWYRTGDAGIIEDDLLRVRGRIDNVIVSGGINVSLDRVERVVRTIPGLESAVVVGVSDDRWGEASVVVVPRGEALRRSESVQLEEARVGGLRADRRARPPDPARARRRPRDAAERQARPRDDPRGRRRAALSPRRSGRRLRTRVDDAEPVALGVFEDDPVRVVGVAVPVDLARAERR